MIFGAIYRAITGRSPKWPAVRRACLKAHPKCECCGHDATAVHHVQPFHVYPDRELDPLNLAAVCDKCHFTIGHPCNWQRWNANFWETVKSLKAGASGPIDKIEKSHV